MAEKPGILEILSFGNTGYGDELAWGGLISIQIAVFAYALGFLIGIVGAVGKLNGSKLTRTILEGYTTLVRAVPELVLILILFFAGTASLNALMEYLGYGRLTINGFIAAVGVLGFVQGAYQTEVLRAAIQAIPIGQIEAARAYGMSRWLEFKRVVLPAMLPNALPGLGNLWLNATKDTSLIAVVGYAELVKTTQQAAGNTKMYFTFYLTAGLAYLVVTLLSRIGLTRLEKRVRRGQRSQN